MFWNLYTKIFVVEPAEHKKVDIGVEVKLSKDFVSYFSIISQTVSFDSGKNIEDGKRLSFLNTSYTKTYSIEEDHLIGLLIIFNKNIQWFNIEHYLNYEKDKKQKDLKKRKTKYKSQKGGFPNRKEFADIGRDIASTAIISINKIAPGFV